MFPSDLTHPFLVAFFFELKPEGEDRALVRCGANGDGAAVFMSRSSPSSRTIQAGQYRVDAHFDETYELTVTKGRFFREPAADDQMNPDCPVGATLEWEGRGTVRVIRVVENFNLQNARAGIHPVVLRTLQPGEWFRSVSVCLAAEASGGVSAVRSVWEKVLPDTPFTYSFLDAKIASAYENARQTRRLVGAGAGLALFVALLGLIGLTGFTVRRRTKKIGIRKALGASVTSIGRLLSFDVAKLIGLAFLIGGPAAYLLILWWLKDFAHRIALTPWPFLAVGGVALACALVVVSGHTIRSTRIDSAQTLRDE